jgi:ComF family protein
MLSRLLALTRRALPSQCAVCHSWAQDRVCPACAARFTPQVQRCLGCALPLVGAVQRCAACQLHPSPLDACLAAVDYDYPWNHLLAQLKFASGKGHSPDPAIARTLATIMRQQSAIQKALHEADWLLPIPLFPQRLQQRGFNQALEIAKHLLSDHTGQSTQRTRLLPHHLLRTRDTPAQVGLTREQRLRNMQHAFAIEPSLASHIHNARVLLVDDVTTTTATLSAAAAVLKSAGASQVVGLAFARTPVAS